MNFIFILSTFVADFPYQYAVYHHFRAKGYVVKDGLKFGVDYLLYKEGPPFYHARYSVRIEKICRKNSRISWQYLSGLNRITESSGKELIVAQVSKSMIECEKDSKISISDILRHIKVSEILIRRWVPSQERA